MWCAYQQKKEGYGYTHIPRQGGACLSTTPPPQRPLQGLAIQYLLEMFMMAL